MELKEYQFKNLNHRYWYRMYRLCSYGPAHGDHRVKENIYSNISVSSVRSVVNKGFTLIEILIVLGIAGLMLAVVSPMLGNVIDNSQVKSATRHLAAGLKTVRLMAINSREEATLILDTENRTYRIGGVEKSLNLPDESGLLMTTAQSEQIDEHTGAIRFFADGSSTGGQIKLSLNRFEYFVDVNWLTGKVSITP